MESSGTVAVDRKRYTKKLSGKSTDVDCSNIMEEQEEIEEVQIMRTPRPKKTRFSEEIKY